MSANHHEWAWWRGPHKVGERLRTSTSRLILSCKYPPSTLVPHGKHKLCNSPACHSAFHGLLWVHKKPMLSSFQTTFRAKRDMILNASLGSILAVPYGRYPMVGFISRMGGGGNFPWISSPLPPSRPPLNLLSKICLGEHRGCREGWKPQNCLLPFRRWICSVSRWSFFHLPFIHLSFPWP